MLPISNQLISSDRVFPDLAASGPLRHGSHFGNSRIADDVSLIVVRTTDWRCCIVASQIVGVCHAQVPHFDPCRHATPDVVGRHLRLQSHCHGWWETSETAPTYYVVPDIEPTLMKPPPFASFGSQLHCLASLPRGFFTHIVAEWSSWMK